MSVLVIGGTGTTGRRVAAGLRAIAAPVRVGSRAAGSGRVHFDWYAHQSWPSALDGVDRVYLVPPVGEPDPVPVMLPFLTRAREMGVTRAVLLGSSAIPAGDTGLGRVMTELPRLIEASVVLRPSWFMTNVLGEHLHAVSIHERDEIVTATGDGPIAFIDPDDIAAVAVRALAGDPVPGRELVLTGPRALTWAEVAVLLSERTGRTVRHRAVSVPEMTAHFTAGGIPAAFAELLANLDAGIARGSERRVTNVVERVTGRAPRDFRDFLTEHFS